MVRAEGPRGSRATLVVVSDRTQASPRWRVATPVIVVASGLLFAVSASNAEGTDLRPGRYRSLASVVETESREYDALTARVSELTGEVDTLSAAVDSREVERYQRRSDRLRDPAGLEPQAGPGVTVELADSPTEVVDAALAITDPDEAIDINQLVVHQQDIQAVVNAMWVGGATAVTIEGQRVISTTGIKCEGNAVQLQGSPYPQPYEISAVGDPDELLAAIESDEYLLGYRVDAADPTIAVGWDLELETEVEAPAYDGLLDLSYAEPVA